MQNNSKRTLEIKIQSEKQAMQASAARFLNAWNNSEYAGEYLTFTSPSMFFEVINARRWDLVTKLQTIGKTSIRELARQVGRDVRRVHDDIKILIEHGIVEQDAEGVCVPYDAIHADFTLMAEAA
jgi:predicted transcriptional regulator